jgi:hypothetical protein
MTMPAHCDIRNFLQPTVEAMASCSYSIEAGVRSPQQRPQVNQRMDLQAALPMVSEKSPAYSTLLMSETF